MLHRQRNKKGCTLAGLGARPDLAHHAPRQLPSSRRAQARAHCAAAQTAIYTIKTLKDMRKFILRDTNSLICDIENDTRRAMFHPNHTASTPPRESPRHRVNT